MFSFHLENSTPFLISKVRVALFFVSWGPGLFLQRSVTFCFIVFLFVLGVPYIFSYGIQSHHFMGNRWGNSGNNVFILETDFVLGGSKITADGDCSHEIKRHLLLGRKVMNNLDSIFKSRDITLPTKIRLVKAMVFPVVMYGCESWTVKKAEH